MSHGLIVRLVGCLALAMSARGLALAEDGTPPGGLAELVERLGAQDYLSREAAHAQLAAAGEAARSELIVATHHADPEVSIRAAHLLVQLDREAMWQGSSVELSPGRQPAQHVLHAIGSQAGIPVSMGSVFVADGATRVQIEKPVLEFWHAVDALCRDLNGTVRWQFDTRGESRLILVANTSTPATAVAGAFRCEVVSAAPIAADSGRSASDVPQLELLLRLSWEPKLEVVAVQERPRIFCGGNELSSAGDEHASSCRPHEGWQFVRRELPSAAASVRIPWSTWESKEPHELSMDWHVVAVGPQGTRERKTIRFEFHAVRLGTQAR